MSLLYFRQGDLLEADIFDDEDGVEGVGPLEEDKDEFYPDRSQWEAEEEEKVNKPRPPPAAAPITEKVTSFSLSLHLHLLSFSWISGISLGAGPHSSEQLIAG